MRLLDRQILAREQHTLGVARPIVCCRAYCRASFKKLANGFRESSGRRLAGGTGLHRRHLSVALKRDAQRKDDLEAR